MTNQLAKHVQVVDTDDGMVLLDERSGRYWQLNATAAVVVRCLEEGCGAEEATRRLTERHPEAAERIAQDVESLLSSLSTARMVRQ